MAQLEDLQIKTQDPFLKLFMSELISFWNSGAFPFQIVSTPPADQPGDVQIRLFDSGAGSIRIYIYSPTSQRWAYAILT